MIEEAKKANHKTLIVGVILVVAIVIILFVPMIPISVAYTESAPEEETYAVKETYERLVTYLVDDRNLAEKLGWFNVYVQSDVTVRNTDKYGGTFTQSTQPTWFGVKL
jgi:flagellar basal body-associated protein FliL